MAEPYAPAEQAAEYAPRLCGIIPQGFRSHDDLLGTDMETRVKVSGAILLALFIMGCDGFTHIRGRVTDINGKPVEGALVEMKTISGGRDDRLKSGADGSFSVGFSHAPWNVDIKLTISKVGYKTFENVFKSADAKQFPATITLESVSLSDDGK